MSARALTSDDIARAVFAAAEESGEAVPDDQSTRLIAEIESLASSRDIQGFATATIDGGGRVIIALISSQAYLFRFTGGVLRLTFLGSLPGLRYEEHHKAVGAIRGYAGEPWVRLLLEHERLPSPLAIEAEQDWNVQRLAELRDSFRQWAAAT